MHWSPVDLTCAHRLQQVLVVLRSRLEPTCPRGRHASPPVCRRHALPWCCQQRLVNTEGMGPSAGRAEVEAESSSFLRPCQAQLRLCRVAARQSAQPASPASSPPRRPRTALPPRSKRKTASAYLCACPLGLHTWATWTCNSDPAKADHCVTRADRVLLPKPPGS